MNSNKSKLSSAQCEELLTTLKARFEKNMKRHKGVEWAKVQAKLEAGAKKLWSLNEMERTGGEPDVVGYEKKTAHTFFLIAQPRLRKAAEVFVTIPKPSSREKNINLQTALSAW